jgi:uncharacterized protein
MALTPLELETYRKTARKLHQAQKARLAARREKALALAQQAARILKDEFGASKVMVFGSVLRSDQFHWGSDIDLAVWDIQHYFRAVARLLDLDPDFTFDLVPIEDARPGILKVIEAEGKPI